MAAGVAVLILAGATTAPSPPPVRTQTAMKVLGHGGAQRRTDEWEEFQVGRSARG